MKTVVIFGGNGFLGQHIIRRIAKKGYSVIVPYQTQANEAKLRLFGNVGQIIPIKFRDLSEEIIQKSVEKSDTVINLKTMWKGNKKSFHKGLFKFNVELLSLINSYKIKKKYIFFSGLALNSSNSSNRIKSIMDVEDYIRNNSTNSCIFKPGLVIGGGDQFLKKLISIFKISYIVPIFGNGKSKLQPVYVDDVAKAVETVVVEDFNRQEIIELAGNEIFTYEEFYDYLSKCLQLKRFFIKLPLFLAKIFVGFLNLISINILTLEQLNLFNIDNITSKSSKKLTNLNIEPQEIRQAIKNIVNKNS